MRWLYTIDDIRAARKHRLNAEGWIGSPPNQYVEFYDRANLCDRIVVSHAVAHWQSLTTTKTFYKLASSMWKEKLFLLVIFVYAEDANSTKSFKYTQNPNGTVTCALGKPSLVIPFDQLSPLPDGSCSPIGARCAWQCTLDPDCTNFNYREDQGSCDLFYYVPNICSISQDCFHMHVSDCMNEARIAQNSYNINPNKVAWILRKL